MGREQFLADLKREQQKAIKQSQIATKDALLSSVYPLLESLVDCIGEELDDIYDDLGNIEDDLADLTDNTSDLSSELASKIIALIALGTKLVGDMKTCNFTWPEETQEQIDGYLEVAPALLEELMGFTDESEPIENIEEDISEELLD